MIKTVFFVFFSISLNLSFSQRKSDLAWRVNDSLEVFYEKKANNHSIVELKGLRNSKTKKILLPPKYSKIDFIRHDRIIVMKDKNHFIVDFKDSSLTINYKNIEYDKNSEIFTVWLFFSLDPWTTICKIEKNVFPYYPWFNFSSNVLDWIKAKYNPYRQSQVFGDKAILLNEDLKPITGDEFLLVDESGDLRTVLRQEFCTGKRVIHSYHLIAKNGYFETPDSLLWADFGGPLKRFKTKTGTGVYNGNKMVLAPEYDTVILSQRLFKAVKGDSCYYFDEHGKCFFKNTDASIEVYLPLANYYDPFSQPLIFKYGDKFHFADKNGKRMGGYFKQVEFEQALYSEYENKDNANRYLNLFPSECRTDFYFECFGEDGPVLLNSKLDTVFRNYDQYNGEQFFENGGLVFSYQKGEYHNFHFPAGNPLWGDTMKLVVVHESSQWMMDKIYLQSEKGNIYEADAVFHTEADNPGFPEYFTAWEIGPIRKNLEYSSILPFGWIAYGIGKNKKLNRLNHEWNGSNFDFDYGLQGKIIRKITEMKTENGDFRCFEFEDKTYTIQRINRENGHFDAYFETGGSFGKCDSVQFVEGYDYPLYLFYRDGKVMPGYDAHFSEIPSVFFYDEAIYPNGNYSEIMIKRNKKWSLISLWPEEKKGRKGYRMTGIREDIHFVCDSFRVIHPDQPIIEYYNDGIKKIHNEEFLQYLDDTLSEKKIYLQNPDSLVRTEYETAVKNRKKKEMVFLCIHRYPYVYQSTFITIDSTGKYRGIRIRNHGGEKDRYVKEEISGNDLPNNNFLMLKSMKPALAPEYLGITMGLNMACPYKVCYEDQTYVEFVKPDGTIFRNSYSTDLVEASRNYIYNNGRYWLSEELVPYTRQHDLFQNIFYTRMTYK